MKRSFAVTIFLIAVASAITISVFEYGRCVILGAPYGANSLRFFNTSLPGGLTPRFVEHAYHDYFTVDSGNHLEIPNTSFYWQSGNNHCLAWRKDLLSYRVDRITNSIIFEVYYETDSTGRECELLYLNSAITPLNKDTVYFKISRDITSNQCIYKEEIIQPSSIDQWDNLAVTLISSNISYIESIIWDKREIGLRIVALLVLFVLALDIRQHLTTMQSF